MDYSCFAAVVVTYNVECENSATCSALAKINGLKVVVYDNSTVANRNEEFCKNHGWIFLGGGGNVGLSKAYNAAIEKLLKDGFDGYVCIFDDDTNITSDYFEALSKAKTESNANIFVPLVYSGEKLISPCLLNENYRVELIETEEKALSVGGISAINSGMAVNISLFGNYRYDENIFLDGIDHNFVLDMRKKGEHIKVFPYKCLHAFSGDEKPPVSSATTRFRIFKKDYKYILRNNKKAYLSLIGKRALSLSIKYKTLKFLFLR